MDKDSVLKKIHDMKTKYIVDDIYKSPSKLSDYLAEFLGYTTILYSIYSDFILSYRETEAKVIGEEMADMKEINKTANKSDKRTVDEKNSRIDYRMSKLKGEKDMFEAEVKSCTIQINGIQSLLKRMADEAKGIM